MLYSNQIFEQIKSRTSRCTGLMEGTAEAAERAQLSCRHSNRSAVLPAAGNQISLTDSHSESKKTGTIENQYSRL